MKRIAIAVLSLASLLACPATAQLRLATVKEAWSAPTPVQTGPSSDHTTHVAISAELPSLSLQPSAMAASTLPTISETPKKAQASEFVGEWIQLNTSAYDGTTYSPTITIAQADGAYTVSGLYISDSKVNATYNAANGTLEILPQTIFTHSTYGACSLNTFTVAGGKVYMNATAPIVISLCADGSLQMSPWGLFVAEGAYKGSAFDAYAASKAGHPNGVFKSTPFSGDATPIEAKVWLSQANDGQVIVANMLGNSRPLNITLAPDSLSYISSQYVMSASLYGDFYIFAANASTGKIDKNNYITVTSKQGGYDIGPWGVFCLASTSIYATWGKESEIITDFTPLYPSPGENSMQGDGSQSNPWKVKTVADLRYIALTTTAANSYVGKYFELTSDIDFTSFSGHWFPIGLTDAAPFQGNFSGNGYKIIGLNQDFSGALGAGLFGFTGASSTLSGITMTGISYSGCGKYLGGIVGYAKGKIENCKVDGSINATSNEIGGVAGYSTSSITTSSFDGYIYGGIDMGGIVAYTTGTITDCHVNANIYLATHVPYSITSTHAMGAIAGAIYGTTTAITRCSASGIVADLKANDHIGGIAGYAYATKITECLSNAQVVSYATSAVDGASPAAGGIVGYLSKGTIEDCMVAGAVNAAGTSFAGGICGYGGGASTYDGNFRRCIVAGMVNTASEWDKAATTGSWFAKAPLNIENCYYDRQATGLDSIAIGHKSTKELTSATLPAGFSADIWEPQEGFYPRLKNIDDAEAVALGSVALSLYGDETIRKVTKDFSVITTGNVKWGILDADGYVRTASEGLTINGNDVKLNPTYASESLIAYLPDGSYRPYTIKVTPKVFEGNGTAESPYLINNVADLLTLQKAVNEAGQGHKGDHFLLTSDIDLASAPSFVGIAATGSGALRFDGTFDGGNHTISNFKLEAAVKGADGTLETKRPYAGFFGICSKFSTIKNLIIGPSCSFTFYRYSAPVAGYSAGKVEHCFNYAPVKSWGVYNGGIVGLAASDETLISQCANFGNITAADGFVGGITAVNYGRIYQSLNAGTIKIEADAQVSDVAACAYAGGITGANYGIIDASENNATIEGVKSVGGIAGGISSNSGAGSITNCINSAMIYGDPEQGNIAAIVGELASSTTIEGNFYDVQLMPSGATNKGDGNGCRPLRTFELIDLLKTNPTCANFWASTSGYPVPVALNDNQDAIKALSVVMRCADSDMINSIETAPTLFGIDTQWSVASGDAFTITQGKLGINLGSVEAAEGTILATTPFGVRRYDVRAVESLFPGAGTMTDPHIIASAADMIKLSQAVNEKGRSYAYHIFSIAANLNFADTTITPIGSLAAPFQGSLMGNGHTITNLKLASDADYTGLIGYGGSMARISDLTIDTTCSVAGKAFVGAFAARFDGKMTGLTNKAAISSTGNYCGGLAGYIAEGATLNNCINKAVILGGGSYIGGLAGVLYGNSTDCHNLAPVNGNSTYVGGLAGSLRAVLTRCTNTATITSVKAQNYIGGIAASAEAGTSMIYCENHGDVKGGKNYVGGLFGGCPTLTGTMRENGAFITHSSNYGEIEGSGTNVAGLAGLIASGHHFLGCSNYGSVTATGGNTTGGIAGETRGDASYTTTIDSCFNYGTIASTASGKKDVGGLVGKLAAYSTITNSANFATVTSKGYMTGGLVGDLLGTITDSYNIGDVTGATYANGGIIGYGGSSTAVTRCINAGNVKATDAYTSTYGTAAGIAGYGYVVMTDCANLGQVYGSKTVGGIAGSRFTGLDIVRCYNTGAVSAPDGVTSLGNIFGSSVSFSGPVWFNSEINGPLPTDHPSYLGITANALMNLQISDEWSLFQATYPIPTSLALEGAVRYAAARYALTDGDTEDNVTRDFRVATYPGFEWTSSDPSLISVDDQGNATVAEAAHKPVTLTLKWNNNSRSYNFVVNKRGSSVESVNASEIIKVEYTDMSGLPIAAPRVGTICLRTTYYANGYKKTEKVMQ